MRIKLIRVIRKPPWFKVWSAITAVALVIALLLTFLPIQVSIDTGGLLSISLNPAKANPSFTARTETYFDAASLTTPFDATHDKPASTAEGDILFAFVCWSTAGVTIDSVPSGWALVTDGVTTAEYLDNADKYALYYKVAGASEPSSYTWSFSATAKVRITCSCYTSGDFNASDPIDVVSSTAYRTTDAVVRAATMTVAVANSPLVFFASCYSAFALTFTKPSVPTTDWVEDNDAGNTNSDFWNEICSMIWSGSGATGDMDATTSFSLYPKHAFAVALNPPASVVAPTVTTQAATNIGCTNFTANGTITDTGGENCTTRGFCYFEGTSGDPTTANSTAYDTGSFGTGAYTKVIGSLSCNVTYRVRAYAINSAGTGYGTTVSVTTGSPGISDTPDSYGFGILQLGTTVATAVNYFTLNNTGNCAVDVTIQGTDLVSSTTLYEYYNTGSDVGRMVAGNIWQAQTFTPSINHRITSVKMYLYRWGYPGIMTVSIQGVDGSGHPDGVDLCSGQIDGDAISEGLTWYGITLGDGYDLVASTQYAIVARAPSGDVDNEVNWESDGSSATYTGGRIEDSVDSGSNWTSWATKDFMFEEWGYITWDLSDTATPSENIYGLYAGLDDADDLFDVIVRESATYNTLVSNLAEDATQDWGLKIYMPTALSGYGNQQMTATITLVASEVA